MKVSTTVCAFLLVLLLCTCTQLASARSLPLNSKHVINREIKKIIKEIVREIKQESALTLADDQPNMSVEECPPPLTRTDENVNTFITGLTAMKCLDEKLNAFNKYIEDTALPFTYSQVNKIIAVFSTYDFIKIHITKVMLKRMVNLTSGEAVTLIKSVASTQMEMYNTLALVKERITDLKDKSSVLVSLFSDADIKTKVQQELDALKKVEENCIFGRVDSEQIVFVIDVSGSMEAVANPTSKLTRLDFVKQHLKSVMSSLKPEQKIEIVYFNNGVDVQFGELKQVNEATINNMLAYLQKKKPGYGTNVSAGLQRAFNMLYKSVASNSRTIYLLSDGIPNEGVTSVSQMKTFVSELSQKTGAKVNTVSFTMGTYDKGETDQVKENAAKMMNSIALAAGGTYRLIKSN